MATLPARRTAALPAPLLFGVARRPGGAALGAIPPPAADRCVRRSRNGDSDELLDLAQKRHFLGVAQRDRHACGAGARRSADAVHIGFRHVRQIEIDDVADAVDIDAARRNVGGDERPDRRRCGRRSRTRSRWLCDLLP